MIADVKITSSLNNGVRSEITVDGQPMHGVRCVSIRHEAGELPIVTLELFAAMTLELQGANVLQVPLCPVCNQQFRDSLKTADAVSEAVQKASGLIA